MKIWRYQFDGPTQVFDMPKGAEVLCVGTYQVATEFFQTYVWHVFEILSA